MRTTRDQCTLCGAEDSPDAHLLFALSLSFSEGGRAHRSIEVHAGGSALRLDARSSAVGTASAPKPNATRFSQLGKAKAWLKLQLFVLLKHQMPSRSLNSSIDAGRKSRCARAI